jgi:uracil-DNA glycosylase
LLDELKVCRPAVVVTLGNAAARVFSDLLGLPQRKLTVAGYGQVVCVTVHGANVTWFPLAHPAAPEAYQVAHKSWVAEGQKSAQ